MSTPKKRRGIAPAGTVSEETPILLEQQNGTPSTENSKKKTPRKLDSSKKTLDSSKKKTPQQPKSSKKSPQQPNPLKNSPQQAKDADKNGTETEGNGVTAKSVASPQQARLPEAKPLDKAEDKVVETGVKKITQSAKRKRGIETPEQKGNGALVEKPKPFHNKEKVLVLSSRGIVHRFRHLMVDLMTLLPHSKKDVKLDTKDTLAAVNEVADLKGCSSSLFFECRKKKDCYMWIAKTPAGPSAKFLVNAIHTMAELKLTGNHLKGSRPLLTFSPHFDGSPHLQLLKEIFTQVFSTPKENRKVKPFFDHVFAFSFLDNHIWFRNYQITVPAGISGKLEKGALEKMSLVEVGPRFCMNPIKVFSGSFSGVTLYQNPFYVSPNVVRANEKRAKSGKYAQKVKAKQRRKQHLVRNPHVQDELEDVWRT